MPNVYVEPMPKGRPEGSPITHYVLELERGARMDRNEYATQAEAISATKQAGHVPLIARVRGADKEQADHWRSASNAVNGS